MPHRYAPSLQIISTENTMSLMIGLQCSKSNDAVLLSKVFSMPLNVLMSSSSVIERKTMLVI